MLESPFKGYSKEFIAYVKSVMLDRCVYFDTVKSVLPSCELVAKDEELYEILCEASYRTPEMMLEKGEMTCSLPISYIYVGSLISRTFGVFDAYPEQPIYMILSLETGKLECYEAPFTKSEFLESSKQKTRKIEKK